MFKKIIIILSVIFFFLAVSVVAVFFWYRFGGLQEKIYEKINQQLQKNGAVVKDIKVASAQNFLGFDKPHTYLLLFLNNTELRPGGGFIGAYAVAQTDKGKINILKVEGTEILDNYSPRGFKSTPPKPLQEYLGTERWEFRDSNWSPDFVNSSAKVLELYKAEKGLLADKIDSVIGFTPTIIEEILKITGPIKADGIEFNSQNFTEKLEYEVEFDYKKRNIAFKDRKKILGDLAQVLIKRMQTSIILNWSQYTSLLDKVIKEKQVMAYSTHPEIQKIVELKKIDGRIKDTKADYVLWVDANLGALKTDVAIDRYLSYSFAPTSSGKYVATLKMKYVNKGDFTWRTTRYRTYARVFLPLGSEFISVDGSMETDRSLEKGSVDQGRESDKQWFGTFISIEPGQTKELVWKFNLSPQIVKQIEQGMYTLFVQKQLGTLQPGLTLDLNFGKNIVSATPMESREKFGDSRYEYKGDLLVDREFEIKISK